MNPYLFAVGCAQQAGGGGPTPQRYWRLTVTAWSANGGADTTTVGILRIAGWRLLTATDDYPLSNMTSDSAPSPLVASASTSLGAGFEPWRAFDSDLSDTSRWASSASPGAPQWVQIDLGSGNEINPTSTKIAPDSAAESPNFTFPLSFRIDGSNTGSFAGEEINFLTKTGISTGWLNNTLRTFTP